MDHLGLRLRFAVEFAQREDGREVSEDEVQRLGKLTERYCVVLQTLVKKPTIGVTMVGSGRKEDGIEREIMHGSKY